MNSRKNLITGGAGFLGTHLSEKLISLGEKVYCLDNFCYGKNVFLDQLLTNSNYKLLRADVIDKVELDFDIDRIWHLAAPASPSYYQKHPLSTLETNYQGTKNILDLALEKGARIIFASSSEVYGNPLVHPQSEDYLGNVNFRGSRSCYDEGKRVAETLCINYQKFKNIDLRIMRIFNTYGPKMRIDDGRVVSNFICSALQSKPIKIYGSGNQTRSFCYVDDLIQGMINLMNSNYQYPLNIGNTEEIKIIDLAKIISKKINANIDFVFDLNQEDEPLKRLPDISKAKQKINWDPKISLDEGLNLTIDWFRNFFRTK